MLNIIEHFVELQGWKFGRLDGKTNPATRQQLVDNFNSDDSYYGMLCTTRTGGVGLNLTGADRIVLYDPDWNPQTGTCSWIQQMLASFSDIFRLSLSGMK